MDKQNGIGHYPTLKSKEIQSLAATRKNPEDTTSNEMSQNDQYCIIDFYELSKVIKLMERESRMAVSKAWRDEEIESYCLMSTNTQYFEMKIILEINGVAG